MSSTINETAERTAVATGRSETDRNPPQLDAAIVRATEALLASQHADGHWVFELEADATIPSEYILLHHFLDRIEPGFRRALPSSSGPGRARMAVGRCSTAARSISAARSRRISR